MRAIWILIGALFVVCCNDAEEAEPSAKSAGGESQREVWKTGSAVAEAKDAIRRIEVAFREQARAAEDAVERIEAAADGEDEEAREAVKKIEAAIEKQAEAARQAIDEIEASVKKRAQTDDDEREAFEDADRSVEETIHEAESEAVQE